MGPMIALLRRLLGRPRHAAIGPPHHLGAAWRSHPLTPDSLASLPVGIDRQVGGVGEIAMGGPNYWTMLLADGAMLHGVCGPVTDVPPGPGGGPLRIALTQARDGLRLQVYDIDAQVIHTLEPGPGRPSPEALADVASRTPAKAAPLLREACRHAADSVTLAPVLGLRLPAHEAKVPPPLLARALADGRRLEARLLLPDDLRATEEADRLLHAPPYALYLDGAPTGLHVADLDGVVEGQDGVLLLPGRRLNADGRTTDGLWLAWREGRWSALLGHAHAPLQGGGFLTPYFLSEPAVGAGGQASFSLRTFGWGPDGELPSEPAPPQVELKVSWRRVPLLLRPREDRITLEVPGGGGPT